MIERIYHCDGPPHHENDEDTCSGHAHTLDPPPHMPYGMLRVSTNQGLTVTELHFCGWDCLLRYAAKFPPPEIIGMTGDDR